MTPSQGSIGTYFLFPGMKGLLEILLTLSNVKCHLKNIYMKQFLVYFSTQRLELAECLFITKSTVLYQLRICVWTTSSVLRVSVQIYHNLDINIELMLFIFRAGQTEKDYIILWKKQNYLN